MPAREFFPITDSRGDVVHLPELLRRETVGGTVMLAAAVVAVVWANVFPAGYEHLMHLHLGPSSVAHWASDGLLTVFFFVAGLELKRELTEGSLRRPARAAIPAAAALLGMVVPALIYLGVQHLLPGGHPAGWAVPVATDIAFALAVLAIAGKALPDALRSFLLTLAIVDDLGAILIIAIAFTGSIAWWALAGAAACCLAWWLLQRRHVTTAWIYVPLALATWALTLASGVHATIAGVALGLLTYCSPDDDHDILDRWEHAIQPLSAGVAVPVFALCAAGVRVTPTELRAALTSPVALGIVAALVIGKLLGCLGGAAMAARVTGTSLRGVTWRDMAAVTQLAGIGFTVALLLAELAFPDSPALQAEAKTAVLLGSVLAAVLGAVAVRARARRQGTPDAAVA